MVNQVERFRLPRQFSGLICCVLYCPPGTPSQEQKDLMAYIIDKLDVVRSVHPDCGIVVLGDFSKLVVCDLLAHHNLKQVVSVPTRGDNVLHLIITNLEGFYRDLVAMPPLGSSGHNIIK